MAIPFSKYQGAGNDFIVLDDRAGTINLTKAQIAHWCNRRFGIGADGLMLLQSPNTPGTRFHMRYFNSDGAESTMCGNGGRCIAHYAHSLGLFNTTCAFTAIDGPHTAEVNENTVDLQMIDIDPSAPSKGGIYVDSGSPHHIEFNPAPEEFVQHSRALRNKYGKEGCNINWVTATTDGIDLRTYERGVEDETLACGTGAVAAAIAAYDAGKVDSPDVQVTVLGGTLRVYWTPGNPNTNVHLVGPAHHVFCGTLD